MHNELFLIRLIGGALTIAAITLWVTTLIVTRKKPSPYHGIARILCGTFETGGRYGLSCALAFTGIVILIVSVW